jgi:hypothetical protein
MLLRSAWFILALADPWIHWLQHLSFFVTALLFWRALLQGREGERAYGAAIFYLFVTSLHTGFWIESPRSIDSKTAMPITGISRAEARHVAAYLYTLR